LEKCAIYYFQSKEGVRKR